MDYDLGKVKEKYNLASNDWVKLEEGDNKIRFVSSYVDYGSHRDSEQNRRVICIGKENGCPHCARGESPSVQFLVWAIERKTGGLKPFRFGYKTFEAISALASSDDYGFKGLPPYDFVINRKGKGIETRYQVIAAREDTELTTEEQVMIGKATPLEEILGKMKDKQSMANN